MNKKIYFTLILIMSIALLGIILVQSFWIKTTLDNKEEQFSLNINQALKSVSEQIQSRELRDYLAVYQKLIDSEIAKLVSIDKIDESIESIKSGEFWKTSDSKKRQQFLQDYFHINKQINLSEILFNS